MTNILMRMLLVLCLFSSSVFAQYGAPDGQWPTYGGDLGHTRYSALDQIDAGNFSDLEVAWRFKTGSTMRCDPTISASQETVYMGADDNYLYALQLRTGERAPLLCSSMPESQ